MYMYRKSHFSGPFYIRKFIFPPLNYIMMRQDALARLLALFFRHHYRNQIRHFFFFNFVSDSDTGVLL